MNLQVKLPAHRHPLILIKSSQQISMLCDLCLCFFLEEWYYCNVCKLGFHEKCAQLPREINYPFHPQHPLILFNTKLFSEAAKRSCRMCGLSCKELTYRCYACNFIVDLDCAKNPPEVVIDHPKSHEHKLTFMPRVVSFTCDACGEVGHHSPWVCVQCSFMVHKDCTNLPRVIRINRHQHRISHTFFRHPGYWICGVCKRQVDRKYSTYFCSVCSYAVHTKCATSYVWDGRELEGTPEETDLTEVVEPFKIVKDGVIYHFSHEHDLRFNKTGNISDKSKLCEACVRPIYLTPFYSCIQCDFFLHEACAKLPLKKYHPLFAQPLSLYANGKYSEDTFLCDVCDRYCSGFIYTSDLGDEIDVTCGPLSEPFNHGDHPHPLFFTSRNKRCRACGKESMYVLSCIECEGFHLCCICATSPRKVRHKYDDHPAILRLGEGVSSSYWCEICEAELDSRIPFYTCDKCGFTSHADCLLGKLVFVKPGCRFTFGDHKLEVIENNATSRQFCRNCKLRCRFPMIFKSAKYADTYLCSLCCFKQLNI